MALLVLAKPLKARRVRLVVERGTTLAELREEIYASEVPLERIVVRPTSSTEEELLSLMDGLRRVSGVREVNSALTNGSAEPNPE